MRIKNPMTLVCIHYGAPNDMNGALNSYITWDFLTNRQKKTYQCV